MSIPAEPGTDGDSPARRDYTPNMHELYPGTEAAIDDIAGDCTYCPLCEVALPTPDDVNADSCLVTQLERGVLVPVLSGNLDNDPWGCHRFWVLWNSERRHFVSITQVGDDQSYEDPCEGLDWVTEAAVRIIRPAVEAVANGAALSEAVLAGLLADWNHSHYDGGGCCGEGCSACVEYFTCNSATMLVHTLSSEIAQELLVEGARASAEWSPRRPA